MVCSCCGNYPCVIVIATLVLVLGCVNVVVFVVIIVPFIYNRNRPHTHDIYLKKGAVAAEAGRCSSTQSTG